MALLGIWQTGGRKVPAVLMGDLGDVADVNEADIEDDANDDGGIVVTRL